MNLSNSMKGCGVGRFIISKYHCFIVIIGVYVAPSAS